jgi:hypothetical protein
MHLPNRGKQSRWPFVDIVAFNMVSLKPVVKRGIAFASALRGRLNMVFDTALGNSKILRSHGFKGTK